MYEIYGNGRYSNLFLSKLNEISSKQKSVISKNDNNNYNYVVSHLKHVDSPQILHNYSININDNNNNKSQAMGAARKGTFANPVASFSSLYTSIIDIQRPFTKCLITYETFGQLKAHLSPTANYFKPVNLLGYLPTISNNFSVFSAMSRLVFPFDGEWIDAMNDPVLNYRFNKEYDDYIVITGMLWYDDYKTSTTLKLVHSQKLDFDNLYISKHITSLLPPYRELAPFDGSQSIPSINPFNGWKFEQGGRGAGEINFFAQSLVPNLYGAGATSTNTYNYKIMDRISSPFICMSTTTNTVYNNAIYVNDEINILSNVRVMEGFTLSPNLESIADYFADWGIEIYTSIDDLFNDDPVEGNDDIPDIGYQPPQDVDGIPDNTSDDVTPLLPNLSPSILSKTYCLKYDEYRDFNSWIASTNFLDALAKYFQDPMDGILTLKLFPFDFFSHGSTYLKSESQINIVNQSRDIACYMFLRQYNFIFSGGEYTYNSYYGDFNDYLASYSVYIPFVGSISLDPSEVVNKTLKVTYGVDILSGQCQVLLYSNSVLIRCLSGVCGMDIPLTGTTYTQAVRNAVNYAVGLGTSIATTAITGIPAVSMAGMGASTIAGMELAEQKAGAQLGSKLAGGAGVDLAVNGTRTFLEMLPQNQTQVQTKSSPCTSLFAPQVPYLSIYLPQPVYPTNRQQLEGYNASMTSKISSLEGYCKGTPYGDWDITGATLQEINMIKQIIQGGFYI